MVLKTNILFLEKKLLSFLLFLNSQVREYDQNKWEICYQKCISLSQKLNKLLFNLRVLLVRIGLLVLVWV